MILNMCHVFRYAICDNLHKVYTQSTCPFMKCKEFLYVHTLCNAVTLTLDPLTLKCDHGFFDGRITKKPGHIAFVSLELLSSSNVVVRCVDIHAQSARVSLVPPFSVECISSQTFPSL